jgi:hypothetical protein
VASVTHAGTTWDTAAGNKTVVATPAVGDAIIVIAGTSGLAGGTISMGDNQAVASTYTQIDVDYTGFSTTGVLTAWVRNSLITAAASTTWTATQTGSSGGGLSVLRISGISIVGLGSIRGCGGQSTGTAGTTPAPVLLGRIGTTFSGTQAALTGNVVISAVANGATAASMTVRSSPAYAEDFDNGYSTPGTGLCVSHINSGETASTITWGSTSATAFASIAFELDASVPQYDYVVANRRADSDKLATQIASVARSNTR